MSHRETHFLRKLDYYLLYMDLSTGNQTYSHVDFWNEGSPYLMSLIALDSNRALVGNGEKTFLLDSQACVIGMPELNVQGEGLHARVNDNLYIQTEKGLVDLLPYIDADDSISRDDFIPTLLNGMIKNGGLTI